MTTRHTLSLLVTALLLMAAQPADAQFLKKIFKKKARTERKASVGKDGIDDDLQTALVDITTLADNGNNRNAFMGIPLGIKVERFDKLLQEKGYAERKPEGKQTAKTYVYDGEVYGKPAKVTLYISDNTQRVFAVDVEEVEVYASKKSVQTRLAALKASLVPVYGKGFVDNGGEGYTMQSRLGCASIHYESAGVAQSYTIGLTIDDAKAYAMAYQEMDDKAYEASPRKIEGGLAEPLRHTDLVGLAFCLAKSKSMASAKNVLASYDYAVGKMNAARSPQATQTIGDYRATVSFVRAKQVYRSFTVTANDDLAAIRRDLQTYGYTTTDQVNYRQGATQIALSTNAQGLVTMRVR